MVDFTLTDEQKDLRELAHNFAEKEIRPVAWDYDRDATWPQDIVDKAWEVGLMNTHIPEEYGGPGLDYLSGCLIEEEIGWGCSGIGTSLMANGLAAAPVILGGSEEVKKKYLGMLTEEPKLASFCLTEPDAGSDVGGMKTTRRQEGRQVRASSGSKCFITNGSHADWYTVYAKTDPDAGHRGISAFVVERDWGVAVDKKEDKLGQRASDTALITFDEVEIPAENLLGEENKGFKLAMKTLDRTRPGVAALAVGIARAAFEFASDYSKERVQFGVPIAMHQAVAFMIADMATKIEAARLLVWQSAVLIDQGKRNTLAASHAKRFAADMRDGDRHRRRPGVRRLRLHQGVPGREADARREDHAALRGHVADPAARHRARDPERRDGGSGAVRARADKRSRQGRGGGREGTRGGARLGAPSAGALVGRSGRPRGGRLDVLALRPDPGREPEEDDHQVAEDDQRGSSRRRPESRRTSGSRARSAR